VIREEKVDRWNSAILLRFPVESDNGIVNSQNLILVPEIIEETPVKKKPELPRS